MNKEKPKSLIEAAFRNPKAKLYRGNILIPAEPLEVEALIQAAAETEEEQDDLRGNGPESVFEEIGWPYDNFISFYWQSMGPMVWTSTLNTVRIAGDLALAYRMQDASSNWQGIALIKGPSSPQIMSAFFKALVRENGAAFGIRLFGSLPSNTDNAFEETLPEKVVRAAYWDWMKWAECATDTDIEIDWLSLAETIEARALSSISYPLELLTKLGSSIGADPEAWLDDRSEQNDRLSERAKRAIFNAYFKQSYGPY